MAHNFTEDDEYIPADVARLMEQTVTPEQYEELVYKHEDLWLELTSSGELIVIPPKGLAHGNRSSRLTYQVAAWARTDRSGVCFGASTVFALPDGARRIPSVSWVKREKWDRLTKDEREGFAPFCPDFVVELRSPTSRVTQLRAKMVEYVENGASLGWLIDPFKRRVYVYQTRELLVLENPETVSGEPLMPGFTLNVTELWGPDFEDLQD